ncbi:hypothetical protein [Deinococcus ruber]|uniref:Uncharacterized protein n=1 Tax=Deinococcus ruber TaxID=1848197 RepID=A0A918C7G8_9DEIO|nr:hypothetical protein [Deinococcus ruber]GGR09658.1 hypothetical protein GCM10008957_23000 [Deinococcus ruber]
MGSYLYSQFYRRDGSVYYALNLPEDVLPSQSYPLFAALANVRNDWGVPQVAPLRAIPEDLGGPCFPPGSNGGTESYVTLEELLTYDWFGPMWEQRRQCLGEPDGLPLHAFTHHFREVTMPAMAAFGDPAEIFMAFGID